MRLYFEKRILIGFFCALAIIVSLGIYSYFNNKKFAETSKLVAHTNEVLFHSEQLLALIMDIESSQRGYVITGQDSFLESYETSFPGIDKHLWDLTQLTSDNPVQQERVAQLGPQIQEKLTFIKESVEARKQSFEAAREGAASFRGKDLMDRIKQAIEVIQLEEKRLLGDRIQKSEQGFKEFTYAFTGLLAITALILLLVFLMLNTSLKSRTKAEKELFAASEAIRDMYDNAPCGYHSINSEGVVIEMNKTMLSWLGYGKEEIIGKATIGDLLVSESASIFESNFPAFKEQGFANDIEFDFKRKDGSTFKTVLSSSAVTDDEGNYLRSRSTVFDITDRKLAEDKVKQLNHELEAFTYSVSHDLRAPLRSIDGYARILEEDYAHKLDAEGIRVMHVVMNNARRMGQLIDDLLEFSRLGRKELAKTDCDMRSVVKTVIDELAEHEPARKVSISMNGLMSCEADISMIKQVWMNLISNAFKYTRKTPNPEIEIVSYLSQGMIIYKVKDNGVGFDMKYIGKLFNVFQRLHKVQDFEGTGVGLAIVYRIITKHGGAVWAEAGIDKGASFFFSIPIINRSLNYN